MSRRPVIVVICIVVGVNLLLAGADLIAPSPAGPASSSFSTSPDGLAAWAELARRRGIAVRAQRAEPSAGTLPQRGTLVVLEPQSLLPAEGAAIRSFAERGGRVIAGGRNGGWVRPRLDAPDGLRWASGAGRDLRALAPVQETDAVRTLRSAGEGRWRSTGDALPVAGSDAGALAAVARAGSGQLVLLADASPLQNRLLDEADNAAFALALAGDGPLVFLESVHGYGETRGFAALPARFKWALALLALAAVALLLARGRRFGPPEPPGRDLPPARREYVDALAATLARGSRDPQRAAEVLAGARARARRAGVAVADTTGEDER